MEGTSFEATMAPVQHVTTLNLYNIISRNWALFVKKKQSFLQTIVTPVVLNRCKSLSCSTWGDSTKAYGWWRHCILQLIIVRMKKKSVNSASFASESYSLYTLIPLVAFGFGFRDIFCLYDNIDLNHVSAVSVRRLDRDVNFCPLPCT